MVSIHGYMVSIYIAKFKFFCAKFHQTMNTYSNWPSQDSLMLKKSLPYLDLFFLEDPSIFNFHTLK